MSLSKIVITGKVVRNPEKRFTGNNLPITSFTLNIGVENEEKLVKVVAIGKLAETAETKVKKGYDVVIEGRLQTATVKTESGLEKKIVEISAQGIEVIGALPKQDSDELSGSDTEEYDFSGELDSEELIGEDEIPF